MLARDTQGTVEEAKRLFQTVDRPNLMIKIPATPEGIPAIEAAIAAGINVNVTLIFAIDNYERVAEAFIRGLEKRRAAGEDVSRVASVASFFLSRIDVMVDQILENNIRAAQVQSDTARIAANRVLLGQTAIANAKTAYRSFQRIFEGERFEDLRTAGAQVQRPLWASTGTKNPAYSDTLYVDNLIGRHTVNTLPPATLAAFKDHGAAAETITQAGGQFLPPDEALDRLAEVGVDLGQVTSRLQDDGVDAFIEAFETLISQVAGQAHSPCAAASWSAPGWRWAFSTSAVDPGRLSAWRPISPIRAFGIKTAGLWKNHGPTMEKIVDRLGWLDFDTTIDRERLAALQESVRGGRFQHVALLGMGGSSLAPEVLADTFGPQTGFPQLIVLDSTDPARIRAVEDEIDIADTLFIVASKSGGTIETLALDHYFWEKTGGNGDQFIVITDPGSNLEHIARQAGVRDIFLNPPDIGGATARSAILAWYRRADRSGPGQLVGQRRYHAGGQPRKHSVDFSPRAAAGRGHWRAGGRGPRQSHHLHVKVADKLRQLGRAVVGGEPGQGRGGGAACCRRHIAKPHDYL